MKFLVLLLVTGSFGCAWAQENPNNGSVSQIPGNAAPPLLQRPYEAAKDFFNFFAFANGVFDSNGAYLENANSGATFGEMVGGGAAGYHQFATGALSVYYNGDYRHYNTAGYGNGTDQSLSVFYQKLFKRWNITAGEVAGQFFQGGTNYSAAPNEVNPATLVQNSPISTRTEYAGTTLSARYLATPRLSYSFTGSYFLERYNGVGAIGSNNLIGVLSTAYRVTRRTTVSGSYSFSNFRYQHSGGNSDVNAVYVTIGHDFASHWTVSASGGASHATSSGTFAIPILVGTSQTPAYLVGPYHQTETSPYYQATATRYIRHLSVSFSGGESVGPGNGYYLASKVENVNTYVNYALRRANISANAYWSRLSSASVAVSGTEQNVGIGGAYAYNLIRHVGLNVRYDYIKYSTVGLLHVPSDNRISFGIYFTSKDVPLSWH